MIETRRDDRRPRRRRWRQRDFIRLGLMLAEGRSSSEIATKLDIPDGRVRATVRRAGLSWLRQPGQGEFLHVPCSRNCQRRLRVFSQGLGLPIETMLSRLVTALSTERDATLIRNLLDEGDEA